MGRLAKPLAVIRDDAVTRSQEHRSLLLPGSTAQRISMEKNNGLTGAVVLIVKIDITGVVLADSNVWHRDSSFSAAWMSIVAPLNASYLRPLKGASVRSRQGRRPSLSCVLGMFSSLEVQVLRPT